MSYNYIDVMKMIGHCRTVIITLNDNTQIICQLLCLSALNGIKIKHSGDNKEDVIQLSKISNILQLSC